MKLAVSNIAWRIDEEQRAAELLVKKGVRGIEVAPGKIAPEPAELTTERVERYREFWNSRGIAIVAMQALLFGKDDLTIFATREIRGKMLAYLAGIIGLGAKLGVKALVFGSPKNRVKGELPALKAEGIAVPFFRELGHYAADAGTRLCIEANPRLYGCDFVTTTREAYDFVKKVDHPGFGLHVDVAAMAHANDPPEDLLLYGRAIEHVHASELHLKPLVGNDAIDHCRYAQALRRIEYANWVSIEMKEANSPGDNVACVGRAIDFGQAVYGV